MRAALSEAKKALGQTSPNPAVGAVLVVGDRIVSRGHHRGAGRDHAEVECLHNFGAALPARATLYVTLEPCSTEGHCSVHRCDTSSGIRNVVIGAIDVNRGIDTITKMRASGTRERLADDCAQINEAFNKWIVTGRPFVIAKCGMSLDVD
jgi:diaminohydroxyphosphoribosylaminopyrimidine deaminase/5-amino-6-(5-phosphoribosylamino)uracil reductase